VIFVKAERDDGGVFFFFTKKKDAPSRSSEDQVFFRDGARRFFPTPRVSG